MTWLPTIVGVVAGASAWGFPGAIVLGFLGWLVGFIIASQRAGAAPAAAPRG